MQRSTDRILTTHAGSLPRPDDWLASLMARTEGRPYDGAGYEARNRRAVADIVERQVALGVDVIDDGEQGKPGFVTYINERLAGFEPGGPRRNSWGGSREVIAFPEFYAAQMQASGPGRGIEMTCTGPVSYKGLAALQRDIDNFKAALAGKKYTEAFMPAISPANVEDWNRNRHYRSDEDYLFAIADALNVEYRAIVAAGLLLQIDDPRLATYYVLHPEASIQQCRQWAELRVAALNRALHGIPEEKVRYHTCYGINMGPRVHDMEMKDIVKVMLKIRAGAYSFEAANPRHEHEWQLWRDIKLPPGKSLVPGVISHTTVLVEHPELVSERLQRYASVVGRDNVIAGSDCGFASFATSHEVHASVVWEKFASLVAGARLASKALWPRARRVKKVAKPARAKAKPAPAKAGRKAKRGRRR